MVTDKCFYTVKLPVIMDTVSVDGTSSSEYGLVALLCYMNYYIFHHFNTLCNKYTFMYCRTTLLTHAICEAKQQRFTQN